MENNTPLVSIILPVFNTEKYIGEAINSVLDQTYTNWELIIVNDGSKDSSEQIIKRYTDSRIKYIYQENKGVSEARNRGLAQMCGAYFCFLDADDYYPKKSLEVRVNKFVTDKGLTFVDGVVVMRTEDMGTEISRYRPAIQGEVFPQLVRLDERCFLGNTWMVKRDKEYNYQFHKGLTHGEDLCFYLSIAQGKKYDFVEEEILWYRKGHVSAMSNVAGLENGYRYFYHYAKKLGAAKEDLSYLRKRIRRIIFMSYLFYRKQPIQAINSLFSKLT